MVYKLVLSCDEVKGFKRVFLANPDSSFLDFHKAILASVGYQDNQMTSFFMCNDNWEKGQEVTLVPMGSNFEYDNMTMDETPLRSLLEDKGQRFIYVFDPMFERYFFGNLQDVLPSDTPSIECIEKSGKAPKQLQEDTDLNAGIVADNTDLGLDEEDFYGDSKFNEEDLDEESFQNLSFEDGTMF